MHRYRCLPRRLPPAASAATLLIVLACVVYLFIWRVAATVLEPKSVETQSSAAELEWVTEGKPSKAAEEAKWVGECREGEEVRGGQGCGRRCSAHGQGRCCRTVSRGRSEVGKYDDVPWDIGWGDTEVPAPLPLPLHSTEPLPPKTSSSTPSLHNCRTWDGEGTRVPTWLVELWPVVASAFELEALQRRVSRDSGSVLLVWIPDRFMPPQKPGKNVRGEVVDAATRGTNHSYYLQEYQALWHKTVSVDGIVYHAQVVSRSALVVCLWERLHISLYQCASSADSDAARVEFHFCQCRHCKDKFSEAYAEPARRRGVQHHPSLLSYDKTPFPTGDVLQDFRLKTEGKTVRCLPVSAAPWLLPRRSRLKLPYEALHNDLPGLLKVQADKNKVVVVFIFNRFWVDHLHNVVFSMSRYARVKNFIVANLDCESLELCIKNRLPCLNAERFAEVEADMKAGGSGHAKGFHRKVTEELSWIKPRLALKVMSLGYRFLMADMDMSWWRSPMQDVASQTVDFAHQCDTPNKLSINTGFYLLRDSERSRRLFENIMVFPPWRLSDQNALKLVVKYDHTHGCSSSCLDRWMYNMKCNYKVDKSEKMVNNVRTFKWKPQQRDRRKFDWFIFHATCLDGAVAKINWLRASNAWFLDDLDAITSAGPYCMVTDEGAYFENITRTTMHSPKYPREKDDSFLRERH